MTPISILKTAGAVVIAGLVLYGGIFLIAGGSLGIYRFWAPEFRDAQREVFEESQSYVQGKISHLTRLRVAYVAAEGERREALKGQILVEAGTVDTERLPTELRMFVYELEQSTSR